MGEPRDLFAGTPAASFAVEQRAIVLPPAKATGPFSKAQVAAALESVRRALIEGRLDLGMLLGDTEAFLKLFDGWVQPQRWSPADGDQPPAGDPGSFFDLDAPAPTRNRC